MPARAQINQPLILESVCCCICRISKRVKSDPDAAVQAQATVSTDAFAFRFGVLTVFFVKVASWDVDKVS